MRAQSFAVVYKCFDGDDPHHSSALTQQHADTGFIRAVDSLVCIDLSIKQPVRVLVHSNLILLSSMARAAQRSTLLLGTARLNIHSPAYTQTNTAAMLLICSAAHAQPPQSGILVANAPTLYLVLSVSGKYFVPFTPVKGLLVMQAIVAASGLSEQDVQYTVGPDFQVRANTTTPRPIIHQQQGLNPANNVTVDPNIDGWLLNVQMRVNGQAGTVMGLMQTALENEQIVKEVSLVRHCRWLAALMYICCPLCRKD